MGLETYWEKRDFGRTPEPRGDPSRSGALGVDGALRYVIQKHDATRLHYDFRLEHDGVLLSWAVPKGPSMVPGERRLAVMTEDHPLEYGDFEGTIPEDEYGGGTVMLWDVGSWEPVTRDGGQELDVAAMLARGKLKLILHGERLRGAFSWCA
ncbi:MAG: DNA polymerase ligase N-terminal domain-containing protein [Myxococcota bacterium]